MLKGDLDNRGNPLLNLLHRRANGKGGVRGYSGRKVPFTSPGGFIRGDRRTRENSIFSPPGTKRKLVGRKTWLIGGQNADCEKY